MPGPVSRLMKRVRPAAYRVFGMLPAPVRRGLVALVSPSFTVGALAVIYDSTDVLFVRQLHRPGLSLPGGLLERGEPARTALVREVSEELDLDASVFSGLAPAPDTAHVDAPRRRVDLVWFLPVTRTALRPTAGSEVSGLTWTRIDDPELTPITAEILVGIAARLPALSLRPAVDPPDAGLPPSGSVGR